MPLHHLHPTTPPSLLNTYRFWGVEETSESFGIPDLDGFLPPDEESIPEVSEVPQENTTKLSSEWWSEFMSEEDHFRLELSGKLVLLAEILRMSEAIGDKV